MMRRVGIFIVAAILVAACDNSTKATAPRGPFSLAGKYVLKTINGDSLPVQVFGDTVLSADSLLMGTGYTFQQWQTITTGGITKEIASDGDFVSTLRESDSVTSVSMLRQTPSYKTTSVSITKTGIATVTDFGSFTYVYVKQ